MSAVVHPAQPLAVDVAVRLRRRQRAVSEQLLDRPQIGTALEQMRRERVAQSMRMREHPANRRRVEPPSARGDEERVLGAADEVRTRIVQVTRDAERGFLAERDDALLAALPEHADLFLLEVDVAEVESDRLVAAQSRGVHELDERAVPDRQRVGAFLRIEVALELALRRRA